MPAGSGASVRPAAEGVRLTLIRHCATSWNETGRYQGHEDIGLSSSGRAMARAIGTDLATRAILPDRVWVSDLRRARETAALALPGVAQQLDPRLREMDFGAFSGATYDENLDRHSDRFREWLQDPEAFPPPGGERLSDLRARVVDWAESLSWAEDQVAVLHVGSLKAALSWALDVPFATVVPRHLPIGAVVELQVEEGLWRPVRGWDGEGDPS